MSPDPNESNWIVPIDPRLDLELIPLDKKRNWEKRSIYKIDARVANLNSKAYRPQVVSFGPYHHGEDHLLPMEEHKRRALRHFVKRSNKRFEDFFDSLKKVAGDLEESYDALDPKWKVGCSEGVTDQFLELMIIDGCFMLEILRSTSEDATRQGNDYVVNDPIFSNHGKLHIMPYIGRDMLLLENQLPMLVLDWLVAVETGKKETGFTPTTQNDKIINDLILNFYSSVTLGFSDTRIKETGKCLHVLDLYRKSLLQNRKSHQPRLHKGKEEMILSATELKQHGIRLKRSKTSSLTDISFTSGVLSLPTIIVDDITESMFLNLIAFERFHVGAGTEITSYIFFMDNIIANKRDIKLLHTLNIIQSAVGSEKAVAKLFHSLCKDLTLDPYSSLNTVHVQISKYCRKRLRRWRASLACNCCSNPWALLSLFALMPIVLLTVYTALNYYH